MGVFAGAFDEQAAAAVAAPDVDSWAMRDALAGLVRKSMVNPVTLDGETSRYQLLETLRAYAREQLEERGEADDVRRRHARHYAELAALFEESARTGVTVGMPYRLGLVDVDDIRAAISWALDVPLPDDNEVALAYRGEPFPPFSPHVRRATGVAANAGRLLANAEEGHPEFEGVILAGLAMDALLIDGDLPRAEKLASRALAADESRSSGPLARIFAARSVAIFCAMAAGRFD